MTEHQQFETLNDYALGRLDDAAEQLVEAHIDACEACLEAVRDVLRAQLRFLGAIGVVAAPASDPWTRQLARRIADAGGPDADIDIELDPLPGEEVRWRYRRSGGVVRVTRAGKEA